MIELHRSKGGLGEISVALRRRDRAVCYRRNGELQSLVDNRGRNLMPSFDAVVDVLAQERAERVLVLGHGGGVVATMLHRKGIDVIAVDIDPRAKRLAQLFFGAPPCLKVVNSDAAAYVAAAPERSFRAVVVDFQDSEATPAAYLSEAFWRETIGLLSDQGLVVIKVSNWLRLGADWSAFQRTLAAADLDWIALGDELACGHRLLVSYGA